MELPDQQDNIDLSDNQEKENNKLFYGYTVKQLEKCYKKAPEKVKLLTKRLLHDEFMKKPKFRGAFFIGKPGTNKTMSAFSVAYQVRNKFDCAVIHCPELTKKGRGATTELLNEKLDEALQPQPGNEHLGTLLILEEGDQILEHATDPHFDNAESTRSLNTLFNKITNNKKAFVITTVNDCATFSEMMKDRILINGVIFKTLAKDEEKLDAFLDQLDIQDMKRHPDCTNEFLIEKLSKLPECSGRNIEALINQASFYAQKDTDDLDTITIKKNHINAAIADLHELKSVIRVGKIIETDYQQRERHQKQNIRVNIKIQHMNQKQTTKAIQGGIALGKEGIGANVGGSISQTQSDNNTDEYLQSIWKFEYPEEKKIEFPGKKQEVETSSSDVQEKKKRKQIPLKEYITCLTMAGTSGGFGGAIVGGSVGGGPGGAAIGAVIGATCGIKGVVDDCTTDSCTIM